MSATPAQGRLLIRRVRRLQGISCGRFASLRAIIGSMKNRLKTLVASMTKRKDGYDPDNKTEQGGTERAGREAIRDAVLSDPFGEPTRRAKRSLLIVSILTLVVNAQLPIEKIRYLEWLPNDQSTAAILGLLSVGLVYLLTVFTVSAGLDLVRWRYIGNNIVLKGIQDRVSGINELCRRIEQQLPYIEEEPGKSAIKKLILDAEDNVPDIQIRIDRTIAYYDSASRLQWLRMIAVDLALPLTVAIIALVKVSALVFPMIGKILSA